MADTRNDLLLRRAIQGMLRVHDERKWFAFIQALLTDKDATLAPVAATLLEEKTRQLQNMDPTKARLQAEIAELSR